MNTIYPTISREEFINESIKPYDLQSVVDKYAFDIYEYIESKRYQISKLNDFAEGLHKMGRLRGNQFIFSSTNKHEYYKYPYIEIFKTSLGNEVIFQTDKRGLYLNKYYIIIK